MDKSRLRKEVFEGMCNCAEKIQDYSLFPNGILFPSGFPLPFKPGVGEKFIFNKILDRLIDVLYRDWKEEGYKLTNPDMIAVNVMGIYYYPYYGEWPKI